MFVFLTTFAFFYLGFEATNLMLLPGNYRKLSVEGNFFGKSNSVVEVCLVDEGAFSGC